MSDSVRAISWYFGLAFLLCAGPALAVTDEPFRVKTDNIPQAQIAGVLWRVEGGKPRGTLFMAHGFHRSMWDTRGYTWIAEQEHFNVVRFDFREHGQSSHSMHLPTLGYYEIYDLKAVIDWAEANHLEKPYLCYGHSMGAAISLRWAGEDPRIRGVLAQSPFRNALDATTKFRANDSRVQIANKLLIHGGIKSMLQEVDIPTAVAKRDDLLLWLTAGDHDYFPEADQRAILAASPSPDSLKRFVLIPNTGHAGQWKWSGNDPLIREFLDAGTQDHTILPALPASFSLASPPRAAASPRQGTSLAMKSAGGATVLAALVIIAATTRFRRRSRPGAR